MSKSQIKRLHEQQELEKVTQGTEEEEDDTVVAPQRKGPANRFAFFDDEDGGDNQSDEAGNGSDAESVAAEQKKARNRAKKNKKKAGKTEEKKETEAQMLARLTLENQKRAKESSTDANVPTIEELMKIDMKLFDMSAEIKRKLGKAFKEAITPAGQQDENRWPPGKRATGRIVKNKPRWFPDRDYGLSMVQVKEENGITWFLLKHSNYYENRERMYWLAEKQMNVEVVHEILSDTTYHLNSLLMMANVSRMNEDFNQSADYIERGIFYVDQYAASSFEPFNWRHRLDYVDYTNRAFFLLLHRHMLNAAQKRCWETAWNTAKMVFKLDPVADPLAITSLIDTYALRAKQFQWVAHMYETARDFKKLDLLPNWPYSVALAKFQLAKTDEEKLVAEDMLRTALRHFPSVVVTLMDSLQIQPDSDVMNCKMFTMFVADNERDSLKLLVKIYVKETEELWKQPENLLFLEQATRKVAISKDKKELAECEEWRAKRNKMYHGSSPNVGRLGELTDNIPSSSISDPRPPSNERMQYYRDNASQLMAERGMAPRNSQFLTEFIRSLMPGYNQDVAAEEELARVRQDFADYLARGAANIRDAVANLEDMVPNWLAARTEPLPEQVAEVVRRQDEIIRDDPLFQHLRAQEEAAERAAAERLAAEAEADAEGMVIMLPEAPEDEERQQEQ